MPRKAMDILTESMFYVLMALCDGAKCGTGIAEFIEKRTRARVPMGPATLYTILSKFEKENYIQEIFVSGRKRTYRITEKGTEAYLEELARLKQCVADAEGGI
jgi:DNA-binding PadR family transcriptional regulator